jgi:YesN/AraC family two-component response regulator
MKNIKMKILIVDDETDIESLFRQKFKNEIKEGKIEFRFFFSAENAYQYLTEINAADIVLILSDINMPGMNGLELLRLLKQKFPAVKVFMITAYDDEQKYKKAIEYGADEYLTKPIDFELLKKEMFNVSIENHLSGTEPE